MHNRTPHRIALVIPAKEGFARGRIGAVGTIAYGLAMGARDGLLPQLDPLVLGSPQPPPLYSGVPFQEVITRRWLPLTSAGRYAASVGNKLNRLRPDLIEVYNQGDLALNLARYFPKIPVILNLQNDPQERRGSETPQQRQSMVARLALVIANSHYIRDRFLEEVRITDQRSPKVLHNSVDLANLPQPTEEREQVILFVGRVVRNKGVDSFVHACANALPGLQGWRAEIIGADRHYPGSTDTDFIRLLRPAAMTAGVALLGYRPHEEVLEAMSRAAIVVIPSRWPEPFGLAALEAMACGAALVTSRRGGLPEVGGEAAAYADPDDPTELAAAILSLATDPVRRRAVALACRSRAQAFDLRIIAARLNVWRRELIAGHGPRL